MAGDGLKLISSAARSRRSPRPCPTRARLTSCRRSPALWRAATGTAYARGTMVGLTRRHDRRPTSRGPRSRPSRSSRPRCSPPCSATRRAARRAARRRRATANAPAHAVPGGSSGRAGRAPPRVAERRARGAYLAGARGRRLGEPRRDRRAVAAGARLRAGDVARRGRRAVRPPGRARGAVEGWRSAARPDKDERRARGARSSTAPQGQAANWLQVDRRRRSVDVAQRHRRPVEPARADAPSPVPEARVGARSSPRAA